MTYDSVKLATLIALRMTAGVSGFTCAKLSEILCCPGNRIREKLHFDAAKRLSCMSKEHTLDGLADKWLCSKESM